MIQNLFPEQCGYEVAKAWCPITSTRFLVFLGIIIFIIIISFIAHKRNKRKDEK